MLPCLPGGSQTESDEYDRLYTQWGLVNSGHSKELGSIRSYLSTRVNSIGNKHTRLYILSNAITGASLAFRAWFDLSLPLLR